MIAPIADIKTLLGLGTGGETITAKQAAMLDLVHPAAEGAVRSFLEYDPEQKSHTELLPRHEWTGGIGMVEAEGTWDVNASHTRAFETDSLGRSTLQLAHLPLRKVTTLYVDTAAYHGKASGSFAAATLYTEGEDYHGDYDQTNFGASGLLWCLGSWPSTPGTVKVTYTAGYSNAELAGIATSDVDDGTTVTTAGVDASPIRQAVMLEVARRFHTWTQLGYKSGTGFLPGSLQSERLGDYSYTLGGTENVASLGMGLSPESEELLLPFRHYGVMRL